MKEVINLFVTLSVWFLVLLGITHLIYHRYFRFISISNLSSYMIMGVGLFLLVCLPNFAWPHFVLQIGSFELAIIWIYLIMGVAQAAIESSSLSIEHPQNRLAMGASVTATAILALLLDKSEPLLHGSILFLSMVAIFWLIAYLLVIGQWIYQFIAHKTKLYVSQIILLSTIAIQVCVLMEGELFHRIIPGWMYQGFILVGYGFYVFGFIAIARYFLFTRYKHVLVCLSGASTLLYSAMAMTGLAMLMTGQYPDWMIALAWWWTVFLFVLIEGLELNRLFARIRLKGIKKALFVYHPSQWLRIFSLTTLYGFASMHLHNGLSMGGYFLTILLIFECVIMINCLIKKNSYLGIHTLKHHLP